MISRQNEKCGNYYTRNVPSKTLYFVRNNKNGSVTFSSDRQGSITRNTTFKIKTP